MSVSLKNIDLYSPSQKAVVSFDIETVDDDTTGGATQVIVLTNGDEQLRFSPSWTDDELQAYATKVNQENS